MTYNNSSQDDRSLLAQSRHVTTHCISTGTSITPSLIKNWTRDDALSLPAMTVSSQPRSASFLASRMYQSRSDCLGSLFIVKCRGFGEEASESSPGCPL